MKKIYDIFPPSKRKDSVVSHSTRTIKSKKIGVVFGLVVIAFFAFTYFSTLKFEINIWPETEKLNYNNTVKLSTEYLHIEDDIIPAKVFTITKEEKRDFLSSGKSIEEKRAEGVLKVYNDYSEKSQTLIAETRFVSADGKLFRSTEKIVVPGKSGDVPGVTEVLVRAVEAGEDYNIEKKTNFSIPGLQGTAMFSSIYAENETPITGGFIGEAPKIVEDDVIGAKEILFDSLVAEAKKEVERNFPKFIFDDDLTDIVIIEESVEPEVGENYESFSYDMKIEVSFLGFEEEDMQKFLERSFLAQIKNDTNVIDIAFSPRDIWSESMVYEYSLDSKNISSGEASILINASVLSYFPIREDLLKKEIAGMDLEQAEMMLKDYQNIEKISIQTKSWMRKVPSADKINIVINFE